MGAISVGAHARLAVVHVERCSECPFSRSSVGDADARVCTSVMPPRDIVLGRRQAHPLWCPLKLGPTVVGIQT